MLFENFLNMSYDPNMSKTYNMTLYNGMVLSNLKLNGNNFISDNAVDNAVFENNLKKVIISENSNDDTYIFTDLILLSNRVDKLDGKTWFILGTKSMEDTEIDKLKAIVNAQSTDIAILSDCCADLLYIQALQELEK